MTCAHEASISVGTVSIDITVNVVYWISLIAFIDINTVEDISQVPSIAATVIASDVVCAVTVHVTQICPPFTLINICVQWFSSGYKVLINSQPM